MSEKWICPTCTTVYPPIVNLCLPCSSVVWRTQISVPTYGCTCGTTARCPYHLGNIIDKTIGASP